MLKQNKRWHLFGALVWVLCVDPASLQGQDINSKPNVGIQAVLERDFPRARIVDQGSLDESLCDRQKNHPGWVEEDFNGDGRKDQAFLLLEKSFGSGEERIAYLKLVVYMQTRPGVYERAKIEESKAEAVEFRDSGTLTTFIRKLNAGEYQLPAGEVGDVKKVLFKTPGIKVIFCDQSSILYQWDQGTSQFIPHIGTY